MVSLAVHGVVLMLPVSSNLNLEKSKSAQQYKQVKLTQLPSTRSSPNPSSQVSSKLNPQPTPQPSQSTSSNLPVPLPSSWQSNLQPMPQLNEPTFPNLPASPPPMMTRQQPSELSVPIREPSSQLQQQFKPQESQQQPTEQPKLSSSPQEPTQSPSIKQPTQSSQPNPELIQSPSTKQPIQSSQPNPEPTQSPSTKQPIQLSQPNPEPTQSLSTKQPIQSPPPNPEPAQSPSAEQPIQSPPPNPEPTGNNDSTGGSYSEFFNKNQDDIMLRAALAQVKQGGENKLQDFKADRDLNQLTESDKFKDATGKPNTKFEFLKKAISPLTTQDLTAALETQLRSLEFRFDKKGTYGGGPLYEVTKGDFKRYVILAPGKDDQGNITAIIISQDYPG